MYHVILLFNGTITPEINRVGQFLITLMTFFLKDKTPNTFHMKGENWPSIFYIILLVYHNIKICTHSEAYLDLIFHNIVQILIKQPL